MLGVPLDTLPEFERKTVPLLAGFMDSGDVDGLSDDLEKARLTVDFSGHKGSPVE